MSFKKREYVLKVRDLNDFLIEFCVNNFYSILRKIEIKPNCKLFAYVFSIKKTFKLIQLKYNLDFNTIQDIDGITLRAFHKNNITPIST